MIGNSICLFILVFILALSSPVVAQNHYFKILTFTINGMEFKDYVVTFEVNGKEIVPERSANKIFVPLEVEESNFVGIKFKALRYEVTFAPLGIDGYVDSDEVKVDFSVDVDSQSPACRKVKKGKCRVVYSLKTFPTLSPGSHLIADPVTFVVKKPLA
jgi:hypothetical protein